jgi:hypothetical protein
VERALFKRGRAAACKLLVVSTRQPRVRGKESSHLVTPGALDVAVTSTPGTGPLNFRCFMPSFFLWLSPPATGPISKLAKPLLPLQLSFVPSDGPLIND